MHGEITRPLATTPPPHPPRLLHLCHPFPSPPLHLYLKGKCSHGGIFDRTSRKDPVGGINKDDTESSDGSLHQNAATLAVDATLELLEDIRLSVGNKNFLRCRQWTLCYIYC